MSPPASVGDLTAALRRGDYLADRGLATAAYVSMSLHRPLLLLKAVKPLLEASAALTP